MLCYEPQLRFLYLCLWFDSSILSVEVTVHCFVYKYLIELFHPKTSTEPPPRNSTRCKKLVNVCTFYSMVINVCLEM